MSNSPYWTNGVSALTCADARSLPFADGSVHVAVTSPPYFCQRDYGVDNGIGMERSIGEYVNNIVDAMREVRRVLRDDGVAWLNLGDAYAGSGKGMLADGRHSDGPKQHTNRGSIGLPVVRGKRVQRGSGSGRWGFGDVRVLGLPRKNVIGLPWRVAFALQGDGLQHQAEVQGIERAIAALEDAYDGEMPDRARVAFDRLVEEYHEAKAGTWILRCPVVWYKPNSMVQSMKDRPTSTYEMVFMLTKGQRYFYDHEAVKTPAKNPEDDYRRHTKQRWDNKSAPNPRTEPALKNGIRPKDADYVVDRGANLRNVWRIPNENNHYRHTASYPVGLPDLCIRASTSEWGACADCGTQWRRVMDDVEGLGGVIERRTVGWEASCRCQGAELLPATVLDPFIGSGTTLVASQQTERWGLGVDLNTGFLDDAAGRIGQVPVPLMRVMTTYAGLLAA